MAGNGRRRRRRRRESSGKRRRREASARARARGGAGCGAALRAASASAPARPNPRPAFRARGAARLEGSVGQRRDVQRVVNVDAAGRVDGADERGLAQVEPLRDLGGRDGPALGRQACAHLKDGQG